MQRAGVDNPEIGVCAINPHAGENGLFGHGEEAEKITPAIEKVQADGIDARGPLPADTAFFLAGRGDYDLIVAMYHDQGHGPVKVLGIEAGVNITVDLPVIRTSVDHGTAFDIAGKGIVDVRSMIEAMRQAAEMSPSPVLHRYETILKSVPPAPAKRPECSVPVNVFEVLCDPQDVKSVLYSNASHWQFPVVPEEHESLLGIKFYRDRNVDLS
ncbi:4-hydroxythreonine-4-phosphate dehydrogenase PdxA [Arthrobacter sp. NPDC058130]|uniref:4-hydroxythreonine-4-phosphate dehydrogenase PdxA n=1 Tax=Arthrobacter sp. NPDC058130 TaxID=3346353 RepID=UPI0036E9985E